MQKYITITWISDQFDVVVWTLPKENGEPQQDVQV